MHQILRPNTDPHEYEPRPDDVRATSGAKVVLENGVGLDHWMAKVVSSAGGNPDGRRPRRRHVAPDTLADDPHWWHDPRNAEAAVARDPRRARRAPTRSARATFRRNADAYVRALRALDRGIAGCFARVPQARAEARDRPRRVRLLRARATASASSAP